MVSVMQLFLTKGPPRPIGLHLHEGPSAEATFSDKLAGRRVLHFIDNTVALSALVHGCASKLDLARMSNLYWLYAASLQCDVYLDWVPSNANISDLPSRPPSSWDDKARGVWERFGAARRPGSLFSRRMLFPERSVWDDPRLLLGCSSNGCRHNTA